MENRSKILIGLIAKNESGWRNKIKEINRYGIREIALFVEYIKINDRKKLYKDLSNSVVESIPHIHLKDDMELWELDFLKKKYKTRVFNLHPNEKSFSLVKKLRRFQPIITIENKQCPKNSFLFKLEIFKKYGIAGICLDLAHLEGQRLNYPKNYVKTLEVIERFPIKCNHISGFLKKPRCVKNLGITQDLHSIKDVSQLSYLKKIHPKYFSRIISIELDNSIKKQLEAKKYIEKIIDNIK